MALLRTAFSKNAPRLRPRHVPRRVVLRGKVAAALAEKHGIAAHSISLRGTAGSPCVEKSIKLSSGTLVMWPRPLPCNCPRSNSPSARILLEDRSLFALATDEDLADRAPASALLCSVRPSGNKPGAARVVKTMLCEAWLITKAFALKSARGLEDANAVFFNDRLKRRTRRYTSYFAADSFQWIGPRRLPAVAAALADRGWQVGVDAFGQPVDESASADADAL